MNINVDNLLQTVGELRNADRNLKQLQALAESDADHIRCDSIDRALTAASERLLEIVQHERQRERSTAAIPTPPTPPPAPPLGVRFSSL